MSFAQGILLVSSLNVPATTTLSPDVTENLLPVITAVMSFWTLSAFPSRSSLTTTHFPSSSVSESAAVIVGVQVNISATSAIRPCPSAKSTGTRDRSRRQQRWQGPLLGYSTWCSIGPHDDDRAGSTQDQTPPPAQGRCLVRLSLSRRLPHR